jgi:hypothetical protein
MTITNTATLSQVPTVLGTPFAGGFYAGRFFVDAQPYALIVAPKASGELYDVAWNIDNKHIDGALSYYDGLANTDDMIKAGSQLAASVRSLCIGGFVDWYLPSTNEALLAFVAAHSIPADDGFKSTLYWTSTQYAPNSTCAWCQNFSSGIQLKWLKDAKYMARAVRRVAI